MFTFCPFPYYFFSLLLHVSLFYFCFVHENHVCLARKRLYCTTIVIMFLFLIFRKCRLLLFLSVYICSYGNVCIFLSCKQPFWKWHYVFHIFYVWELLLVLWHGLLHLIKINIIQSIHCGAEKFSISILLCLADINFSTFHIFYLVYSF